MYFVNAFYTSIKMQLLENIRAWKNKHFSDWFWDLLIGLLCCIPALIFGLNVLLIPFIITVINQLYNRLFEPKDFALRMTIPILIQLIQIFL